MRDLERKDFYFKLRRIVKVMAEDYGEHLQEFEGAKGYIIDTEALEALASRIFSEIQDGITYIVEPIQGGIS